MSASRRLPSLVLIATVGVSLFQNFRTALDDGSLGVKNNILKKGLNKLLKGEEIKAVEETTIRKYIRLFLKHGERKIIEGRNEWVLHEKPNKNYLASAELQSLYQYFQSNLETKQPVFIYFIVTDTDISELAAKILKEILPEWYSSILKEENQIQYRRLNGLQIQDANLLANKGFGTLLNYIIDIQNSIKGEKQLIINMTGGFKGIIPVLSLVAQLVPSNLMYSFEYGPNGDAGPLLEIPPINLHFLWDFLEAYEPLMDRIIRDEFKPGDITYDKVEVDLIEKELIPFRICQMENQQYKIAPLGKLLLNWIKKRAPVAKSALGFFLEYKFFEYLIEEPWMTFLKVRHSVFPFEKELDLYLEDPTSNKWIWGEVKSYQKIKHAYDKRRNHSFGFQLKKYLDKMVKTAYRRPEAYHLFIYKRSFQLLSDPYFLLFLKRIKSTLEQYQISEFKLFYVDLDLNLESLTESKANPYTSKLMPRKFTVDKKKYMQYENNPKEKHELIREFIPDYDDIPEFIKPQ